MQNAEVAIIVPCYNEYNRIDTRAYEEFLCANPGMLLIFVNDGSLDNTSELLAKIHRSFPGNSIIIELKENKGKSFAVHEGANYALNNIDCKFIGYLDSDLSTRFEEYKRIYSALTKNNADYAFGSRIRIKNSQIYRKVHRHLIGRIISTLIDIKYALKIYDTQCGSKIFSYNIAKGVFKDRFYTTWLFDVEIFIRIRKMLPLAIGIEVPLLRWREKKGSSLTVFSFGKVVNDMFTLYWRYDNDYKNQ